MSTKTRTIQLAMLGFSLTNLAPSEAHAYYAGSAFMLTSTTYGGITTTIAGLAALIVITATKDDVDGAYVTGSKTRDLLDSGLIAVRGDLGIELNMLVESPTAFDRFSAEVLRGEGAGLNAMAQATNLPTSTIAAHWATAMEQAGSVNAGTGAVSVVNNFIVNVSPELAPTNNTTGDFAWQLAREQASGSLEGAMAHEWLASWLGVTVDDVALATRDMAAQYDNAESFRSALFASPDKALDQISATIEMNHGDAIDTRIASLKQTLESWAPAS